MASFNSTRALLLGIAALALSSHCSAGHSTSLGKKNAAIAKEHAKPAESVSKSFSKMIDPNSPLSHPASEKALEMLGSEYKWGGSAEATGMDCSGFVFRSYKDATGLELPRSASMMAQRLQKVLPHEMRAGDLVFFNTMARAHSHVGIYLGGSLFAHSPKAGQRARIDNIASPYWLSAFDGARRPSARPSRDALAQALNKWDPSTDHPYPPSALPPLPPSMLPNNFGASLPPAGRPLPPKSEMVGSVARRRSRVELASAQRRPEPQERSDSPPLDVSGMSVALPQRQGSK